jgi:TPR repeat protein
MKSDHEEAFKWFLRAAKFGQAKAQYFLGYAYARGKGTDKDEATAVKWYVKSAEQGETEAQVALGFAYLLGKGVPKDEIEAYAYFNIAGSKDEDARKYVTRLEGEMTQSIRVAGQQRSRLLLQEFEAKKESLRHQLEENKKSKDKKGA